MHILSPRQRAYVKHRAQGVSPTQAAKAAGFSPSYADKAGSTLETLPPIMAMLSEIREEVKRVAVYDLVAAMQEAKEAAEFARTHRNPMALVKATELRAKLSGLLVEQIHVKAEVIDLRGAL